MKSGQMNESDLEAISGGFTVGSICVGGYCAVLSSGGLQVGPKHGSYGTQAYNAVVKGMNNVGVHPG